MVRVDLQSQAIGLVAVESKLELGQPYQENIPLLVSILGSQHLNVAMPNCWSAIT